MSDQVTPTGGSLRPPQYVIVPVSPVYAEGYEGAILTLIRILGLCWKHGGRRTPALSREQLARELGRSPRTLRRHLAYLQEQGWLQVEGGDDHSVLRPLLHEEPGPQDAGPEDARPTGPASSEPVGPVEGAALELYTLFSNLDGGWEPRGMPAVSGDPLPPPGAGLKLVEADLAGAELLEWTPYMLHYKSARGEKTPPDRILQWVMAAAGIQRPVRDQLACDPGIHPLWVRGWHLWTQHPHRATLGNPAGYIVQQLRAHNAPPGIYQQLAALTAEQVSQLRMARWIGDHELDDLLRALYPLYLELFPSP